MAVSKVRDYQIEEGEKVTSVMCYTQNNLIIGDAVTKQAIRVSTWLRSTAAPRYIYLRDAQVVSFSGGARQQSMKAILIPRSLVIAYHITPPAHDPVDFDAGEANRKMEPVRALVGPFQFSGLIRMSTQTSLDRFLDVAKESYTSIYELEISNPALPQIGIIRSPFALLNNELVIYSPR